MEARHSQQDHRRQRSAPQYLINAGQIATGLAFALSGSYAVVLLVGVMKLAEGKPAWDRWVAWLVSPLAIGVHVVLLAAFAYHAWTWFNIMPRTLPPIMVAGRRVSAQAITRAGLAAAAALSLLLLLVCWRLAR